MSDFFEISPQRQEQRLAAVGSAALVQWGMDSSATQIKLIKYRENAVYEVQSGGQKFALRLHRSGYHSDAALSSELVWMKALAQAAIRVPTVIPTLTGELFTVVTGAGLPGPVQIDLFEWVEGKQLGSVEGGLADVASISANYHTLGALAAALHNQASTWEVPADFQRHAWDHEGLAGDQPFWDRFWELDAATSQQRALLRKAKEVVYDRLSRLDRSAQNYSMIHADLVVENVLLDGDNVRLIDFDDAGFGWHLFEIATTLYFILDEPFYPTAFDALISGYRSARPLTDQQLELLPLFLTARGLTYLGWVHTRKETETARELTPMLLAAACRQAERYLSS